MFRCAKTCEQYKLITIAPAGAAKVVQSMRETIYRIFKHGKSTPVINLAKLSFNTVYIKDPNRKFA